MKNKLFSLFILTVFFSVAFTGLLMNQEKLPNYFYKKYIGIMPLGQKPDTLYLDLSKIDTTIIGNIFRMTENSRRVLNYNSRIDKDSIFYEEADVYTYIDSATGRFKGKFFGLNEIKGYWTDTVSSVMFPMFFNSITPKGSVEVDIKNFSKIYVPRPENEITTSIVYPVIKNFENKEIEEKMNKTISRIILDDDFILADTVHKFSTPEQKLQSFIDFYKEDVASVDYDSTSSMFSTPWYCDNSIQIEMNREYLFSFSKFTSTYIGGAHGGTYLVYYNYDLKTGKKIELNDIFLPGYEKKLNAIGEVSIRKYYQIDPSVSLNDYGFWFEDSTFKINKNFLLTESGIEFLFNEYEVCAYAFGTPRVFYPFSDIKELIRKDCILNRIMKFN